MRNKLLFIVALIAALSTASVAMALAVGGGADPEPPEAPRSTQPPVAAVQADQSQRFAVLRRQRGADDDLGPTALRAIEAGPGPDLGANAQLARRAVDTASGDDVHVVPADGWLCLVSEGGIVACNRTAEAVKGYLVSVEGRDGGIARVRTVVPDGVGDVDATASDGTRASSDVSQNAAVVDIRGAIRSVSWTGPDGQRTVPLGPPPER